MNSNSSSVGEIWNHIAIPEQIVATAIHDGHQVRQDLKDIMLISERDRLREEDPYTGLWTSLANNRLIGNHSRFEVDLNRPREKAVYIAPEDAWGLHVWQKAPTKNQVATSLAKYDAFYDKVYKVLKELELRYGSFVVFDLHTYNHLRNGQYGTPADPDQNPEVNVGTGTLDRNYWAPVIDQFITSLKNYNYFGRHLDVRENVKFRGGNFPRWINHNFPKTGCAIAIEFKKFFMDEWSGQPDLAQVIEIGKALDSTVPIVLKGLEKISKLGEQDYAV